MGLGDLAGNVFIGQGDAMKIGRHDLGRR